MKNELKVSRFVLVCALCLGSYASYGASSVRALGGSGTYTSASSASSASSAKATAVRGGSMRVTPTGNKGGSSTTTGSVGTTVKTPRLSIGNYLGGGTSISGGSSLRPQQPGGGSSSGGGSVDPDLGEQLQQDIDDIRGELDGLHAKDDELTGGLDAKQDALNPVDGYIIVDGADISIDVNKLIQDIETSIGQTGNVQIDKDDNGLLYRVGDGPWQTIITYQELANKGGYALKSDLTNYSTTVEMNQAISDAITGITLDFVKKEDLATVATTGSYNDLKDKPVIPEGAVVDSELTDGGVNAVQGGVIKKAIDAKADQTVVDALAGRVDTVESGVANAELTASAAKEIADSVKTDLSKKEDVANKVGSAGFDAAAGDDTKYPSVKAVADKLSGYATTEALDAKENVSNKATAIDDGNKTSADAYPSVGAIVQWTDKRLSELSTDGLPVNPEKIPDGSIGESKLDEDLSGKINGKEDKANIVQTIRSSVEAEETKYTSEKAVATALEGKADSGALADLATKEELEGVKTTAEDAQSTAGEAKTTAETAKTTADSAKADAAQALTEATEAKTAVNSKVDKAQGAGEANKVLITDGTGNVITGTVSSGMITDGTISDADIAPDAAISRSKLAPDVQTSLDTADKAVSMEGADINSVLGTDESGNKVWYKIAF